MDNQQLQNLNNQQLQVLLTGKFGDGHLANPKTKISNSKYSTSCVHKEYIEYKQKLLGNLAFSVSTVLNTGYKIKNIYTLSTKVHPAITELFYADLETSLNLMDELGVALWFYDDGSLHKDKYFYNLNTHKFSKEVQKDLFIPFFKKYNIFPKLTKEVKKDGRTFWYLRISKFEGAYEVSKILQKYPVKCFDYKVWSSETIQKWSKLQVELKRRGVKVTNKKMSELLKCETTQDIVRSLEKSKAGVISA